MVKRKIDQIQEDPKQAQPTSVLKLDDSISIDTPFPRGGGSGVAPLEIRQATVQATRDVFDEQTKKKRKHKTKVSKPEVVVRSNKPRVEQFILSKLKVGTLSLGQIAEIHPEHIVVSLPNNVFGFLSGIDLSCYTVGEYIRCIIAGMGATGQKRLQLVIEPALVNQSIAQDDYLPGMSVQGTVKSVEDKGYILDLGDKSAFLPKSNATSPKITEGKIILTTIKTEKNGIYTVTQKDAKQLSTVHEQASLVPGTLISAQISSTLPGGYMCSVFGHIDISLAEMYAGDVVEGSNEDTRVLFSHPADSATETSRVLALSCLASTLELAIPKDAKAFTPGQILEDCKVTAVTDSGLYLNIGISRPAFVHISNISDEHIENLDQYPRYKVGTIHSSRVLGYSYIDDVYYLTLKASILSQKYLKVDEVQTGEVLEGTVDRFLPKGGIIIAFGENLKAICPEQYISDTNLKNPEKKFKVGQKVTARVLSTNAEEGKFKVAIKKSIVHSDAEIITDFPEVGDKTIGTIIAFKKHGAVIEFFNNITGYLPAKEMSESNIVDPKTHFRIGQTISVSVLDVDADKSRLVVSCRASRTSADGPQPALLEQTKAIVTEKLQDSFTVQINGHSAVLPFELLTDKADQIKAAKKAINVGKSVEVLVLQTGYPTILTTTKSLLMENNPPKSLEELTKGEQVYGYVRSVDDAGIFVSFANGLVGLLPKGIIGDNKYTKGETVSLYVSAIDQDKGRFLLSPQGPSHLTGPADTSLPKAGDVVTAVVTSVKQMQLNVTVGEVQGRLEMTQVFDSIKEIEDVKNPLLQFSKGDKIKCTVVGYHDARNHKFLPISHRTGTHIVLELSALKSGMKKEFKKGDRVLAFVNNISDTKDKVYVNLTPTIRTRLSLCDLTNNAEELENFDENFSIGRVIEASVYDTSPVKVSAANEKKPLAIITKVTPTLLYVKLPHDKTAIAVATDALDVYKPLAKSFNVGDVLPAKVVEFDESNEKTYVSFQTAKAQDKPINSASKLATGQLVRGFIKNVANGGVFIQLGRDITGRVQISQLSDQYLKDWKKQFKVGQVVDAKVLSKASDNRIELTLKQSAITGKSLGQAGIEDLEVGSITTGVVRSVQDYGVFIGLDGGPLSGLCHKTEVADKAIADLSKVFNKGDHVKVKVLDVDLEKRKISLGMKASYFGDDEDMSSDEEGVQEDLEGGSDSEMEVEDFDAQEISLPSDESDSEAMSDDDSDSDDNKTGKDGISAGFDWDADILDQQQGSDSSDSDDDDDAPRKRKRGEKFVEDKTATLNSRAPQSAQDFERLLVSNPDSSVLWMNYMAFQIQLSEIESAREIARRALKTIPIREENEKQNIWIALLNLENSFGTDDTAQQAFKDACTYMDPLTMHKKMAGIYSASDKVEAANKVWNAACKRFGADDLEVWYMYAKFLFDTGSANEARKLLERAVKVIPSRNNKEMTLQFAKLEYAQGDAERGRTLMEGLVSSYPRKIDVWNVYIDQELKTPENRDNITRLFERILKVKLTAKQAKFFFKKWLSYEVEHGDTSGVDYVKSKAQKFVDNI